MKLTYINESLQHNKIIRWPDNCFPLKFYIAPYRWYNTGYNDDYKFRSMVIKALEAWEKVSKGKVLFEIVGSLHESQINLDWKRVDRKALGHCYFHFDNIGRLYSAEVQIGISDGILHQEYMDDKEVYHTILHEIGHSLGLGHSPFKTDIMYTPHQYGRIELSSSDALTLQWLYRLPYGQTPSEVAKNFPYSTNDIDEIIYNEIYQKLPSNFEKVKNSINAKKRNLEEEQAILAKIKKHNMHLQQIKISPKLQEYIEKSKRNEQI